MKRTNTRLIKLPTLLDKTNTSGLSDTDIAEFNLRAFDYVRRTAVPTLNDYGINSFKNAVIDNDFELAKQIAGVDTDGILIGGYTNNHTLDGKKILTAFFKQTRIGHEVTLTRLKIFLEQIVSDNMDSVTKEKVRKVQDTPFVSIEYLMGQMERFDEEHSTVQNKKDFSMLDKDTNKKLPLDSGVQKMAVYLEQTRLAQVSDAAAAEFFKASSLKSNLEAFRKAFEAEVRGAHGVPVEGLEENVEMDYELSDGTGVRYLFFPKSTSISYSKIKYGLVTNPKGRPKNITGKYGDLEIVKELAFKPTYEALRAGSGLVVETLGTGKTAPVRIVRQTKGVVDEENSYRVFNNDGAMYISVKDVFARINSLKEKYASEPQATQFKIDFFSAMPENLR
ncbi:hypothetical protein HN695_07940 [Candidatus Woesearchaeota archaeon]|nr:hypothetical protein [Candidatus Woesearchaeota archaeon]MBT5272472.1 hypothetical protein [Candidatus Woesearchaeota archaeon]MBT6041520.1 hypothetical protein [Candidatus Woesearchaeota archaeon]MBT6336334.1 hypothetical protein [Candidatus Woesearchaeota archaeon]MBT7928236.1 hypothetical protein [Candidatus Woesearchaeota archaeon]